MNSLIGKKVVLASSNQGKLRELQNIMGKLHIQLVSQADLGVPDDVAETGTTFVENAIIKARHACLHSGLPAVADDSGIEVDALHGAPGVYSARYAQDGDEANNVKLLHEMRDIPESRRQARFVCVMVFMRHAGDATPIIAQGVWNGLINHGTKGEGGFGYDPLFYLPDRGCTSAQLPAEEKNHLSHRGQATRQLIEALQRI